MSNLIPPGTYAAVVVPVSVDGDELWAQFGRSKTKGTPQVGLTFAILDKGPCEGRRIGWYGYFTDDAVDRTVESLRYCGFKGDELADLPKQRLNQEVQIVVEHEEYDGKTRAKVQWVNAAGGGGLVMSDRMSSSDLRTFSARFKNRVKAKAEVGGKKIDAAPTPIRSAPPEPNQSSSGSSGPPADWDRPPPADDDIPF